ncbi:MAG: hypothetical protein BWY73_01235 [candidate division TA06 bacterium ADurb.Bin417]|uniref:Uncharacterized protein n=1 Tax=candidate division TA06 bacterium ADurb.Bin417 TaxID=1852828 RepID=A0A1V5MC68_UNCT6|nr:MAG: hypothetical protein BWY73_01235 [candidate division TA06 bacterium ADurb.Bin417]
MDFGQEEEKVDVAGIFVQRGAGFLHDVGQGEARRVLVVQLAHEADQAGAELASGQGVRCAVQEKSDLGYSLRGPAPGLGDVGQHVQGAERAAIQFGRPLGPESRLFQVARVEQ